MRIIVVAMLWAGADMPLGLDWFRPVPDDNPMTKDKVALGKRLFSDRRLSRDHTLSCASCHDPKHAFTDGRTVAVGIAGQKGKRNAPTLVNRVWGASQFWDGRAPTLEKQVLDPIYSPLEMALTPGELERRMKMPANRVAQALASYVRTILSGESPFDRHLYGDRHALSGQAKRGLGLFRGKANCTACHSGPNLTDERFHNTGVAWRDGRPLDEGRFTVTGQPQDRGAFKTPTVREIARTAPYMHDGSLATLEDVIDFYDRGGRPNPNLDSEIRPLRLTAEEKAALTTFLRALTGIIQRKGVLQ
jgi:cytochrome c peroxidase